MSQSPHKLRVAIVMGSRSVEHEVSVVSAMQVFASIDRSKYEVIPIYIDKHGRWLTGKALEQLDQFKYLELHDGRSVKEILFPTTPDVHELTPKQSGFFDKSGFPIDVVFPVLHGTYGEDGTIQGLFELADIPYVGCGVTASAVGMDKVMQKAVFAQAGLPVVKHTWFFREEFDQDQLTVVKKLEKLLPYPMVVKPANLGSSVGITLAKNRESLVEAIEVAQAFDRKILVEEGLVDMIEINCSVIGYRELQTSVCEQPVKTDQVLSYTDKYMNGGKTGNEKSQGMAGLARLIPAPIPEKLAQKIQEMTKLAFRSIDGSGIARIDFMVRTKNGKVTAESPVYINEINTLPGSLAFYLWEATGVPFAKLIDQLIGFAFERHADKKSTTFSIETGLLESLASGSKGAKA